MCQCVSASSGSHLWGRGSGGVEGFCSEVCLQVRMYVCMVNDIKVRRHVFIMSTSRSLHMHVFIMSTSRSLHHAPCL